jgi:hypothetical protein
VTTAAKTLPANIAFDLKTVKAMIRIFCRQKHSSHRTLCAGCEELAAYAEARLTKCPYGENKTTCRDCPIHCYTPDMRRRIAEVMRYAGPRMIWHHPVLAARHVLVERKGPPTKNKQKK